MRLWLARCSFNLTQITWMTQIFGASDGSWKIAQMTISFAESLQTLRIDNCHLGRHPAWLIINYQLSINHNTLHGNYQFSTFVAARAESSVLELCRVAPKTQRS